MKDRQARLPELLIPAGNLETLRTAVRYGADAVYIGGEAYGLRAKAGNFTLEKMAEGIRFAHSRGVRVYVTANILAHNRDLAGVRTYFEELKEIGPDALIIADPAIFALAKEILPETDIHISTQANNTNYGTFLFWHGLGAKRAVTGRELSLEEIREIRERIPDEMEIETFVHGAMCVSYSGRCLLSSFMAGREANLGACAHPCRWKYAVVEETRPGEYMPVYENDRGTFLFNSRDLCMIGHLPDLLDAGVDSLKVEGRMKAALYVAATARTYRQALDDLARSPERYRERMEWYKTEIGKCTSRPFTTGFFYGKPDSDTQIYDSSAYICNYIYLGTAGADDGQGRFFLEQRNKFSVGEEIEIMKPDGRNILTPVEEIRSEEGVRQDSAPHAGQRLWVKLGELPEPDDILRRRA